MAYCELRYGVLQAAFKRQFLQKFTDGEQTFNNYWHTYFAYFF